MCAPVMYTRAVYCCIYSCQWYCCENRNTSCWRWDSRDQWIQCPRPVGWETAENAGMHWTTVSLTVVICQR